MRVKYHHVPPHNYRATRILRNPARARCSTGTLPHTQRYAARLLAGPKHYGNPARRFGYAVPVLEGAPANTRHLMPPAQGSAAWPSESQNRVTLADDTRWPFADNSCGALLLMHAVEHSADPLALLREAWRCLAPQGQLWLVVPNRRGLWALAETTPFGRGQPYTATQLRKLLHAAQSCLNPGAGRSIRHRLNRH